MVEESGNTAGYENDDIVTGGTDSNFVDDGEMFPSISDPNLNTSTRYFLNKCIFLKTKSQLVDTMIGQN